MAMITAVALSPQHGPNKVPQAGITLVAGIGVEGDAHAGATVKHRSRRSRFPERANARQVHLIHAELHDELRRLGFDMATGEMGENVTTRGVDLLALPRGTWLALGAHAVVELTGLRTPCSQLDGLRPGLMAANLGRDGAGRVVHKAGVMAIVVAGGPVRPGDAVTITLPPPPHQPLEPV